MVKPLRRTVWRFLTKLRIKLPYEPEIPQLGIHAEKARIDRDTCTPILTAALFTIDKVWKQLEGLSTEERTKGILLSCKKEAVLPFAIAQMNLKGWKPRA